ncbi:MAG: hypothetical protein RLY31_73 [Bacteroidota bacterium]|jgi:hypothetical protein
MAMHKFLCRPDKVQKVQHSLNEIVPRIFYAPLTIITK